MLLQKNHQHVFFEQPSPKSSKTPVFMGILKG